MCYDGWDAEDAHVVCLQLGYSGHEAALRGSMFGEESDLPIWMSQLECTGSELVMQVYNQHCS